MFRKIVSNLNFSPALVGQLGFYAKRLRREEATRRLGLIFTALALVVQSFAVFAPPAAANAASAADFVRGGVSSPAEYLKHYDNNTNGIRDIFKSLGITRAEIAQTKQRTIQEPGHYNWSLTSLYSHAQGQRAWTYDKAAGGKGTAFYRPMELTQQGGPTHQVFVGYSQEFGWFAIKKDCGNLVTKHPPKHLNPAVVCENLTARSITPTRFRITAKASKQDGATISGYTFSVTSGQKSVSKKINTKDTTASYEYTNDMPGTYKVSVTVHSSEGPKSGPDCRTSFDINTSATCKQLVATRIDDTKVTLAGSATAKQGVDIKKYVYTVRNADGKVVAKKTFNSAAKRHSFVYTQATPGKYKVSLTVVTSIGERTSSDCRAAFKIPEPLVPAAACTNVEAIVSNRTIVSLSGSASASQGATISKYTFVVKDKNGNEVKRVSVNSTKKNVTADSFNITVAGDYSVKLTVKTSLGDKTNTDNCEAPFEITKQEVCQYNPSLPPDSPDCQPCPENPDIWVKDEDCSADVISTKTSNNMTQGNVDATSVTARASDKISYTLSVENKGYANETVTMTESLEDVLEYAKLVDMGGGIYNSETKTLTWPAIELAAGQKQSRTIAIQLLAKMPASNTGTSNEASYDCTMTNTFGNSVAVKVECPPQKVIVEQVVKELPHTGPRENMLFAAVLLSVVVYFYARSRQLGKEVRLVRRGLNTGTI